MERIIQSFDQSDYDMVSMLILLDNLNQDELEKLVHFFVYKLVDKKIPEYVFVDLMQYTSRTRIDFGLLKHIKEIIELLCDDNHNIASELLIVLCDMKDISKKLNIFIRDACGDVILGEKMNDVGEISGSGEGIGNESMLLMAMSDAEKYIKAFTKPPLSLPDDISSGAKEVKKYDQKYITELFEIYYREEILNRLILLRNYYSLTFLEKIQVDVISIDDYEKLSYSEAVIYYCICVKKIKHCIATNIKLCKNYISLKEHYNGLLESNTQWKEIAILHDNEENFEMDLDAKLAEFQYRENLENNIGVGNILDFIRNLNRRGVDDVVDVRLRLNESSEGSPVLVELCLC
ncbi:MAG: hypothetical protein Harvfovirus24_9 [Harvfovirus sp.]|uniref:Uncharacterized protein n=1 Tax=Harvfovirus sp. TaxID=2487768 RepID=A0A3G5A625_9VIRU|nr:MAG: hypothetical protein Harvfovirus24_9 [Harvfovirus sp.]